MAYTYTNVKGELEAVYWYAADTDVDVYSDGVGDDRLVFDVKNLTNDVTGNSPLREANLNNGLADEEVKIIFPAAGINLLTTSSDIPNIYVYANHLVNISSSSLVSYIDDTQFLYFSFVDPDNIDSNTAFFPVHASGKTETIIRQVNLQVFTEFMNSLDDYNKIFSDDTPIVRTIATNITSNSFWRNIIVTNNNLLPVYFYKGPRTEFSTISSGEKIVIPDFDLDGLTNNQEFNFGSNPREQDTDNDGLTDLAEFNLGTNPNNKDADNDGVDDVADNAPNIPNPDQADADNDGVGDVADEFPNDPNRTEGTPPVIEQLDDIIQIPSTSLVSSIKVSWVAPTITDNSGQFAVSATHQPGDSFSVGITQVTYTAFDNSGNSSSMSFNVQVISREALTNNNSNIDFPSAQSCFRKGTLVKTDQGTIEIQNIQAGFNTINNKEIKCLTAVYNSDGMVFKIEKDCLGENKPSNTIYMQKDHKLMISPAEFSDLLISGKIQFEKSSSDELLYNILLDTHETMFIENIEVETLNPELAISKYFMGNRSEEHKAYIESNTQKMIFC